MGQMLSKISEGVDTKMKKVVLILILIAFILSITGCGDRLQLDKATLSLIFGLDLKEGRLEISQRNPVFSKDAKEKSEELSIDANSIRQSRDNLDMMSTGNIVGGKLQILLIGKALATEHDIFKLLDVIYRDPKNAITARMVTVDGTVEEIMTFRPKDKPRMSEYLNGLLDSTKRSESTLFSTMQHFHRHYFEKGITPFMPEIKLVKDGILVSGSALYDNDGKYVTSLTRHESSLVLLLQKEVIYPVPISLVFKKSEEDLPVVVSFDVINLHEKINTTLENEQLKIHFDLTLQIRISELIHELDAEKDEVKLEKLIKNQLETEMLNLVSKLQENKLDPIGLGIYVRANHFEYWEEIKDDWGMAFSEVPVTISSKIYIDNFGVLN